MINKSFIPAVFTSLAFLVSASAANAQDPGNWTLGWTSGINVSAGGGGSLPCPDVAGVSPRGVIPSDGTCTLSGTITEDLTLFSTYDWLLDGAVFIGDDVGPTGSAGDPAILTVNAGTEVFGKSQNSFLVISRGSKIFANGTQANPVVFASPGYQQANFDTATGLWGGLIINGRSQCNCTSDLEGPGTGEGEVGSGQYGGGTAPVLNDNSGRLKYVQILFAGFLVNSEQELNGIAFQGVGSGTEVDFVQIHNGQDDGVEFFGGTVNVKHVVITGANDDGFDWTEGWSGKAQHVVIVQNPQTGASDDPRGIEADNNSSDNNALPRSKPMLANFTLVGPTGDSAWPGNNGVLLRRGTGGHLMNIVVSDFEGVSLDIDDAATYTQLGNGGLKLESFLAGNNSQGGTLASDSDDTTLSASFLGGMNDFITTPTLVAPAGGGKAYVNGATENGATPVNPASVDAFFDATSYIGAVQNNVGDWTNGWTYWLHN